MLMFSTVLWIMMSNQEAAFFLYLGSSAVAPVFLMTLHRMNTRGSSNSSSGKGVFPWDSWLDAVQAETQKAYNSIIGRCMLKHVFAGKYHLINHHLIP